MGWGGRRPGSGRPKGSKSKTEGSSPSGETQNLTPLDYMLKVMNDPHAPVDRRDRMARAAAQYVHKKGDRNQKASKEIKAQQAATGRFAPAKPPLRVVGRHGDEKK